MKSWIILIVLAVATTAVATVAVPYLASESSIKGPAFPAPSKPAGPAPVVEVEGDLVHQFGVLPQQKVGKNTWIFKNIGAGTLELRGMSKTCSCTTAELFGTLGTKDEKQISIKPGESQPIEVTFETRMNNGSYHQTVTVGTNDPSRPEIALTIEGTVRPALTTIPPDPSMSYGIVSNEEPIVRKIALFSADRPELKLTRATSSNPALVGVDAHPLTAEEMKGFQIDKGYAIEVTLKPSTNLGAFAEEILVETDHPMMAVLRFKVTGKVTGSITALPERVTVRDANANNGGSEVLTLLCRSRPSVNFTVDRKPQGLDVAIEPIPKAAGAKGSKYKMTVKVVPGTEPGRIVDEIVLKTDDPKASEVKLPVDVLVQGAK